MLQGPRELRDHEPDQMAKEKEPAMAKPTTRFAISIEPGLAKRLVGMDAARIEEEIEDAVREILGTTSPEELRAKLSRDRGLAGLLRIRLAMIESEAAQEDREGQAWKWVLAPELTDRDLNRIWRSPGVSSEETIKGLEAAIANSTASERRPGSSVELGSPNNERPANFDADDTLRRIFLKLVSDEQISAMTQLIVRILVSFALFFVAFPTLGDGLLILGVVLVSAVVAASADSFLKHLRLHLTAKTLLKNSTAKS